METKVSFGSVSRKPEWRSVYVVGGGPSLKGFNFAVLRNENVIAVNDSAVRLPWATALFSLDQRWIRERRQVIEEFQGETYLAVGDSFLETEKGKLSARAVYLRRAVTCTGISTRSDMVAMGGGNSGYGAVNLASLKGARTVFLLGFDFTQHERERHWHAGYPWQGGFNTRLYDNWARTLDDQCWVLQQLGVTVYNCSSVSRLTRYAYIPYSALPMDEN